MVFLTMKVLNNKLNQDFTKQLLSTPYNNIILICTFGLNRLDL